MTDQDLLALSRGGSIAPGLSAALTAQLPLSEINTPRRREHFLAQCCEESTGFTKLEESLSYSAARIPEVFPKLAGRANELAHKPEALGNAAYADRYGNGDEASGDGFRYRGRGLLQHTFKANYAELAAHIGFDVVANPEALTQPDLAVKAAIYYFVSRGCCEAADAGDVEAVTRKINGGVNGLQARIDLTQRAQDLGL